MPSIEKLRRQPDRAALFNPEDLANDCPILICLLGSFRLLKTGQPVPVRGSGKTGALLSNLALRHREPVSRDTLIDNLWPDSEPALAGQALNSLVYSVQRSLGVYLGGAPPVLHEDGYYRLNVQAGIGVDIAHFDALVDLGNEAARAGDSAAAAASYKHAVGFYGGDLIVRADLSALIERERLRARFLTLLAWLADHYFGDEDYQSSLDYARRLLAHDPCREDAHRLVMRCCVRLGERAQALRQYRVCEQALQTEFDARPEAATRELFERVRSEPETV